jgi:integrase
MASFARSIHLASSKAAYKGSQSIFIDFCKTFSIEPFLLSEDDLCLVICHYALQHTVNSVPSYVSAIQKLFDETACGPLPRSHAFHSTMRGLKRLLGPSDQIVRATAISIQEVAKLLRSVTLTDPDEVCFGAQTLTAYMFGLRAQDHCDGRLRMGDIYPEPSGAVSIVFPPGKSVRLFRHAACVGRNDELDLLSWFKALYGFLPPSAKAPTRAVFVSFKAGRDGKRHYPPVTRQQFISEFKRKVSQVLGRSPALYTAHSLRRGLTTDLISGDCPLPSAKAHIGWTPDSNAIFSYNDTSAMRQKLLPTSRLPSV